jgi:hypothetical protein
MRTDNDHPYSALEAAMPTRAVSGNALRPDVETQDWQSICARMGGAFVVLVTITGERCRRRPYMTVAAAQRAVERAVDRGETAVVVLAELRPLHRVTAPYGDLLPAPAPTTGSVPDAL